MNIKIVGGEGVPHMSNVEITDNEGNNIAKDIYAIDIQVRPDRPTIATVKKRVYDLELENVDVDNIYIDLDGNKYKRIETKSTPTKGEVDTTSINSKSREYRLNA